MSFDLGDTVRLEAESRDAGGTLTDASTAALTITLPDGTTTSPAVTNPPAQTGQYRADYVTVQPGRHVVRWVFSGPASAYTDVFDVREAVPPLLFSLDSAKAKLDIPTTSTGDDEELREFIEATTKCVEFFVGPIVRRTVTQVVRGGNPSVLLHTTPVMAVTSITGIEPGVPAVDTSVLDVDTDAGVVRRTDGAVFNPGLYRAVYVAGRTAVPANASLAAKLILQHLWRTNYGAARGLSGIGGGEDFAVTEPIPGLGYAIPNRALQLLQGDRDPGGFA